MQKILIVEDEDLLRDTYKIILSTEPYIVNDAADGEQALNLCRKQQFDLILLDLMMPKVDGVTFLEQYYKITEHPAKIIILSNLSSGDDLAKALELGAHKSIVKANMSPRQLLSMVRFELPV
jgi:two-component system response regulator ResD